MDDSITVERHGRGGPIETVSGVCGVPARLTGFVSLVIQAIVLIVSCALVVFFFFHIGGYASFTHAVATTIGNNTVIGSDLMVTPPPFNESESAVQGQDEAYNLLNQHNQTDIITGLINSLNTSSTSPKTYQGPFEQIPDVELEFFDVDWDLLSVLRALCCIYVVICAIWLISLICLLLSIKMEILDLVCINSFFVTIAFIFQLVLAILIIILLFYHKSVDVLLYIIAGTAGILLLCFIFSMVALVMVSGWFRYIDYMNGNEDTCLCTSTIVRMIKRSKRPTRGTNTNDYSIPEATRHSNLPYIDEAPVQQFSNF